MLKTVITSLALLFYACNIPAAGFKDSRDGKWSFSIVPMVTNSKVLQFDNGAEADISKRSGFGFTFGYNVDEHIELSLLFSASNSNYTGTRTLDDGSDTVERFNANLYTSTFNFDFTWNILSQPLTPYINLTAGSTYIDSGIPTGNIGTGCWWDPWWGYICTPVAQTYTTSKLNYGAGAGLRYDFSRRVFIKGGVMQNYLDINTANTADFTTYQLGVGFMF